MRVCVVEVLGMTNEENILIATVLGGHKVATGSDGASCIVNPDGTLQPLPDYELDSGACVFLAQSLEARNVEWEMGGGKGMPYALVNHRRSWGLTATIALADCLLQLAQSDEWV
jgi:hypothetical protein